MSRRPLLYRVVLRISRALSPRASRWARSPNVLSPMQMLAEDLRAQRARRQRGVEDPAKAPEWMPEKGALDVHLHPLSGNRAKNAWPLRQGATGGATGVSRGGLLLAKHAAATLPPETLEQPGDLLQDLKGSGAHTWAQRLQGRPPQRGPPDSPRLTGPRPRASRVPAPGRCRSSRGLPWEAKREGRCVAQSRGARRPAPVRSRAAHGA